MDVGGWWLKKFATLGGCLGSPQWGRRHPAKAAGKSCSEAKP